MGARPRIGLRLTPADHELIRLEAELQNVTVTEFVRTAAVARAAYLSGQRSDDPGRTIERIAKRLRND